jgi:hypothetical protein
VCKFSAKNTAICDPHKKVKMKLCYTVNSIRLPTRPIGTWQRARSKSASSVGAARLVANIASAQYVMEFHIRTWHTQLYTRPPSYDTERGVTAMLQDSYASALPCYLNASGGRHSGLVA